MEGSGGGRLALVSGPYSYRDLPTPLVPAHAGPSFQEADVGSVNKLDTCLRRYERVGERLSSH